MFWPIPVWEDKRDSKGKRRILMFLVPSFPRGYAPAWCLQAHTFGYGCYMLWYSMFSCSVEIVTRFRPFGVTPRWCIEILGANHLNHSPWPYGFQSCLVEVMLIQHVNHHESSLPSQAVEPPYATDQILESLENQGPSYNQGKELG